MAIYAVNRSYFWNSNACLKAWPLLRIRCSIRVHPWLRNEETNRRFVRQNAQRIAERVILKMDNCRGSSKSLLDYVIRQVHLIFGTAE
jgi:hypothetical protein